MRDAATFHHPFALVASLGRPIARFSSITDLAAELASREASGARIILTRGQHSARPCGSQQVLIAYADQGRDAFLGYACGLEHEREQLEGALELARAGRQQRAA